MSTTDLTGKMLIAMPSMGDPRFERSVIFMCAHSDEGAMGLIVNKPADGLDLNDLLTQLSIEPSADLSHQQVHFGGPVEPGRGFVLHTSDYESVVTTLEVDAEFRMTATLDVLEDIARGTGPQQRLMLLGYAGWGPGQLESELAQNGWLVCDASPDLVFDQTNDAKWQASLESLGVSALNLSSEGGRA
ncbi:YqgE/AlgH family protein [Puniceibacterium sp. IMCC21224]|uniref:YqgE/AlgH family protein n=1 Tax=Puniceibacterium sp. IMCC21224 TaxID=1618204 RepID=UPI00064DF394|nr:YqgE/AlgH family protein [Puniceibacterium sp. IMCC21224]KMK66590.1 putative transcriptional regulator [Puniceibacterium sp. IMCC21224]